MAKFEDKSKKEARIEVHVPEGLELSEEELQGIRSEFETSVVDTVAAGRAVVALKVKVIPQTEEVSPKIITIPKVKA